MGNDRHSCFLAARNRILIGLLAGSALVSMTGPASAQTASPSAAKPDDHQGLDEIVVTAQRRSERLQDVPLTVVALSNDDLAKSGVTSLRDLGTVVSGFTFGGLSSASQPAIRGVTTTISASGAENPNALYVDGIYQQSQYALNSDLPDVERIEVLKGPQGTLFGRNATGGAIQIFTRGPSFTPEASFTLEPSYYTGSGTSRSSPRIQAKAFATGPIATDLLAASLSVGYDYTQGYSTNDADGSRIGVLRDTDLRGKLLITPTDYLTFTLGAFYIKGTHDGYVLGTPYNGLTAASVYPGSVVPTLPYHSAYDESPLSSYNELKQYGGFARIELKTDAGTISSLSGYTQTNATAGAPIAWAQSSVPCLFNFACIDSSNVSGTREFSQELNFASRQFGIASFVAGLYYYDAEGGIVGLADPALAPFAPGVFPLTIQSSLFNTKSYAEYGEVTIKATERLSMIVGGRYNHEPHNDTNDLADPAYSKSRTFSSFTPRESIKYELTDNLNAYETVSVGTKSGLTGISNTASVPPFKPVDAEKLISYETGLKYASRNLSLNPSFFFYDYKNKQEQTFTGTSAIIQNTGPVRIYGLDMDTRANLTTAWSLRGTFSWIPVAKYRDFPDASGQSTVRVPFDPTMPPLNCAPFGSCGTFLPLTFNATGMRLIRAPKVTASGTLSYETGPFDASTTVFFSSAVLHDITGVIRQPSYATLAAQVGYKLNDRFKVGVFGRNLTNREIIESGLTSLSGFGAGYAPPREVGLSFNFNY